MLAAERVLGEDVTRVARGDLAGAAERHRLEPFLANAWYPASVYRELHAALQRASGRGPELARELSYRATREDLKGPYRFLLSLLSLDRLVPLTARIQSLYVRGGRMRVVEARRGYGRLEAHIPGSNRSLWSDVLGGSEAVLGLARAENLRLRYLDGGGDEDHAVLGVWWSVKDS